MNNQLFYTGIHRQRTIKTHLEEMRVSKAVLNMGCWPSTAHMVNMRIRHELGKGGRGKD